MEKVIFITVLLFIDKETDMLISQTTRKVAESNWHTINSDR